MANVVLGDIFLFVSDPEITKELMTTKNKYIDKDGKVEAIFAALVGYAILFGKSNNDWRQKRKHLMQVFNTKNMNYMQSTYKRIVER